ncbi:thiamine diphosphokinase [Pelolinea submarina]|uniref:Thiamine diphosphokinase n=1 Tax=Pelolinea submarina TaxID=913107 RepID=A0A347ZVS9_9CHLR|nr:thiamine diphosphokinase [Pelolinea submarina]REG07106.1 thiamine pyrophosphokinase [Pelolinea submarina]BBB49410.1 thiamine pyrophosphokinase [Pelolinea submarina]
MRAVIFANGELQQPERLRALLRSDDYLISADGGLRHLRALDLRPQLLIGDLDSVSQPDVEWLAGGATEIRKFPAEKDFTDLELALRAARERGTESILLAAALGGRLDQTLANIALLRLPELSGMDVSLDDGLTEVRLITANLTIHGHTGDIVSLIPQASVVKGVRTHALQYPLNAETLSPGETRGISNVMLSAQAAVEIESGELLCVHLRRNNQ